MSGPTDNEQSYPPQTGMTGVRGRCPRCGEGPLFDGYLALAPRCSHCDLDFSFADSADGPAVFIMMIVGFVVVGLALYVEFTFSPPMWLHAILWVPLIFALALGLLRPVKGWLIVQQYLRRAEEARFDAD